MQSTSAHKRVLNLHVISFVFMRHLFVASGNGEQEFQEVCSSVSLLYDTRGHVQLCVICLGAELVSWGSWIRSLQKALPMLVPFLEGRGTSICTLWFGSYCCWGLDLGFWEAGSHLRLIGRALPGGPRSLLPHEPSVPSGPSHWGGEFLEETI